MINEEKLTNIIVVAEGDEFGGAQELSNKLKDELPWIDYRVTILGHIQRGEAQVVRIVFCRAD